MKSLSEQVLAAAVFLAAAAANPPVARAQAVQGTVESDAGEVLSPFLTVRGGLWGSNSFEFRGSDAMVVAGGDVGVELFNRIVVFGGYDRAVADGNWISSLGGNAGFLFPLDTSSPWEKSYVKGMVYGGVTYNEFFDKEIDEINDTLGLDLEFKKTVGRHAGFRMILEIPRSPISLDLYAEGGLLIVDLDVPGSPEERIKYGGGGFGVSLRF